MFLLLIISASQEKEYWTYPHIEGCVWFFANAITAVLSLYKLRNCYREEPFANKQILQFSLTELLSCVLVPGLILIICGWRLDRVLFWQEVILITVIAGGLYFLFLLAFKRNNFLIGFEQWIGAFVTLLGWCVYIVIGVFVQFFVAFIVLVSRITC